MVQKVRGSAMDEMNAESGGQNALDLAIVPTAALTAATRAEIIAMCNRAFGDDRFTSFFDYVTDSMHVLGTMDGALVGHACWTERRLQPEGLSPLRTAYVDAVAMEPGYQGRGIGSAVMRRLARETAACQLQALSTDDAAGFYERLGWERWRGPTAGHTPQGLQATNDLVLIHRTSTTPALDLTTLLIADDRGGQPW
jgi:aminoglycoside 2'-N-acetyltransferase I